MDSVAFTEYTLSRLMLGTVQFGMPYGVANRTGQPSFEQVCAILTCAYEGGVTCLDTAASYGSSEDVVGKALAELGLAGKMTVVTKTTPLPADASPAEADVLVERSVAQSLKRLRLDVLPLLLIHHEEDFRHFDALLKLQQRGLVRHVGASVMTPAMCKGIVNSGLAEAVQAPTSLLDRRYLNAGVFRDARRRGLGLFVRSMYLQGLILLPPEEVQAGLAAVAPVLQRLRRIAGEAGIGLAELCIRYVLALEGVTCGVVGIETLEQMRQNVAIFNKGPLPKDLLRQVIAAVPDLPDSILMPNKWPKAG